MAFVGGSLFEVGAYLGYVEALNAGHEEMCGVLRRAVREYKRGEGEKGSESLESLVREAEVKGPKTFRWM